MSDKVNTVNDFLFGSNGKTIASVLPVVIRTRQQAYRTAAWLRVMALVLPPEVPDSSYEEVQEAVNST